MTMKQLAARDRAMAAEMAAEFLEDVMPVGSRWQRKMAMISVWSLISIGGR